MFTVLVAGEQIMSSEFEIMSSRNEKVAKDCYEENG